MDYKDEAFENATEIVDGNSYNYCTFKNCHLQYHGGDAPQLIRCTFINGTRWSFEGSAGKTMRFLRLLWLTGDEYSRGIVSDFIAEVQRGFGGN